MTRRKHSISPLRDQGIQIMFSVPAIVLVTLFVTSPGPLSSYNAPSAFAASAVLTLLALVTLFSQGFSRRQNKELNGLGLVTSSISTI
jgi:ABC-type sulfate transport system permease subunit